ncbi:P60-like protein [Rickenella mellea]|uniref:Ribosome biogenesis protein NOP53 n=1 Tax=Rickenella mellea TaxID=50990 RepID=A0A4Y7QKK5_9AGAM|nr:P60-like protein [Rickenella mellea]
MASVRKQASLGTPAQHSQPSRKGKKAWRKHVDIEEVEEGLEGLRAEERVTGSTLQKKKNEDLFTIDVTGDHKVRKSMRFSTSQLSYTKMLAQRSAVAAVYSRPSLTTSTKKPRSSVSREDKVRMLRMAKRKVRGPLNTVVDPTEQGSGSAILDPSHAVMESGTYDVWADTVDVDVEMKEFLPSTPPQTPSHRSNISIPAIRAPHQGTSYNPPAEAHSELIRLATAEAERKERDSQKFAGEKESIIAGRQAAAAEYQLGVPLGMTVDVPGDGQEDDQPLEDGVVVEEAKKPQPRKTKQQRRKAERVREEKRALAERAAKKRFLVSVGSAKAMRLAHRKRLLQREQERELKRLALEEKMRKKGMAGMKLGKHAVPEGQVEVQLGEELSESLRALKPEGNLFKDRFLSLQHRALVEPRVPVLPRRRKNKTKEVEKFAWKRFE